MKTHSEDTDNQDSPQNKTLTENAFLSIYHSIAFTTIVAVLYYYKRFLRKNSETHIGQVLALVAVSTSVIFFFLRAYVPNFYSSTINGVGWGIGMTLMKHVLID